METVVKGTIVCPGQTIARGWIGVSNGTIVAIGEADAPAAATVFDYGDDYILPGAIDGQTHAGSASGLVGLEPTTRSAIAGGVTTIVDMPYDNPDPVNTPERLSAKIDAIAAHAHCNVALYATIMPGQSVDDVRALIDAGVVAFKISAFESSPTRFPRIPADLTLNLLEALAQTDIPLGLHNEDQEIVLERTSRFDPDKASIHDHSTARPEAAELSATAQFLELGMAAGAHAHPVHLSSRRGFELVEHYRQDGARATGELCVHYLAFDPDEDGDRLGPLMKVNPPIRPGQRNLLWRTLTDGLVAFVSSDHSSWPVDGKRTATFFAAGAGVPGLETLVPAMVTIAGRQGADPWQTTAEYLSTRPAKFFGLASKGQIAVGANADLMVLKPGHHIWDSANAHDGLNWSPFDGWNFSARVAATFLAGSLAWDGDTVLTRPGAGRYLPRGSSRWFETSFNRKA